MQLGIYDNDVTIEGYDVGYVHVVSMMRYTGFMYAPYVDGNVRIAIDSYGGLNLK